MGLTTKQLELRKTGISASEVSAVLGLNPYRRPINVWQDKMSPISETPQSESQELGHFFEKHIGQYYATKYAPEGFWWRLFMPQKTLVHPEINWAMATPDRFVFEAPSNTKKSDLRDLSDLAALGKAHHLAEIKLVGPFAVKDWITDPEREDLTEADRVPLYVFCQCQWQMLVTGYDRVDVPAMLGGTKLRVFQIERDQEFINDALTICESFRKNYILKNVEPPPDGSKNYSAYLGEKFAGTSSAEIIEAPQYAQALALEHARLSQSIKELSDKKERVDQMLKTVIGNNDGMHGPWGKVTWRLGKGRVNYSALVRDLNLPEETLSNYRTPSRTFRVTVKKELLDAEEK